MTTEVMRGVLDALQQVISVLIIADLVVPLLGGPRSPRVTAVLREVMPFAWPLWAMTAYLYAYDGNTAGVIADSLMTAILFWRRNAYDRDDDDQRWKRRRQRLSQAVRSVSGRLVVMPTGGRA